MAKFPAPAEGIVLTHFIVASDIGRSQRFYAGGPPTDDKPTVTLEPPHDPDHVSSFLNIRVADIHAVSSPEAGAAAPQPGPVKAVVRCLPSWSCGFDYRHPLLVLPGQVSSLTCQMLMISWPSYGVTEYQMVTPSEGRCS